MSRDAAITVLDQLVGYLLVRAGCHAVPVDLERLARYLGVSAIERRPMGPEGFVESDERGGYRVVLRADRPPTRTRFSLAHELGHVVLARLAGRPSFALGRKLRESAVVSANFDEEAQADHLAGMILAPSSLLGARLPVDFSMRGISDVARECNVSIPTVLIRAMWFATQPVIAFHLRLYDDQPSSLRCLWARSSRSAPFVSSADLLNVLNGKAVAFSLASEADPFLKLERDSGPLRRIELHRRRFEDRELVYGLAFLDSYHSSLVNPSSAPIGTPSR